MSFALTGAGKTEDIRIQSMSITDCDAVIALWSEVQGVVTSGSDTRGAIQRFLDRNRGFSFVAERDGKIVGAVLCGHDGRRGQIYHLAVAPAFRRQGIARALFGRCLQSLGAADVPVCRTSMLVGNARGQLFWESAGWSERSHLKMFTTLTGAGNGQPEN